jgi:hypothetical protein
MKKLDDIPKENIFEVPEGYFDRLPLRIQARIEQSSAPKTRLAFPAWRLTFRYAVPVAAVILVAMFFLMPKQVKNTEDLLAEIASEHLIAYLHESDITESDLLEILKFDETDADSLNLHVGSQFIIKGIDIMELKSELENEL